MREVMHNIYEKIKPAYIMAIGTVIMICIFVTLVLYIPFNMSNDRIFMILAILESMLIIIIGVSMYRLLQRDSDIMRGNSVSMKDTMPEINLIDNISNGILYINSYGMVKAINRKMCELIGLSYSSIVNKYISSAVIENKNATCSMHFLKKIIFLFEQKTEINNQEIAFTENEKIYRYIINTRHTHNEDGSDGYFVEAVDVSDKENDFNRLMQVERLAVAGQMVAGLAHEIKNSICSMKGLTQVMKKKQSGQNDKYYDVILEEVNHTNSLVQNLLSLTKTRGTYESMDINKVVSDIVPIVESQAAFNGIFVNFDIQSGLPCVFGNKEYIKQVVVNIVQNAMDELKESGRVEIKASLDEVDGCIKLEFKDNGPGIKAEYIDKIFEPFFTTKEGGSGLGLAICCEIIKKHQGDMFAYNNPEGGATFVIKLPTVKKEGNYCRVS